MACGNDVPVVRSDGINFRRNTPYASITIVDLITDIGVVKPIYRDEMVRAANFLIMHVATCVECYHHRDDRQDQPHVKFACAL